MLYTTMEHFPPLPELAWEKQNLLSNSPSWYPQATAIAGMDFQSRTSSAVLQGMAEEGGSSDAEMLREAGNGEVNCKY